MASYILMTLACHPPVVGELRQLAHPPVGGQAKPTELTSRAGTKIN